MGASERVPVVREHVRGRGKGRAPGSAEVGASERVPGIVLSKVDYSRLRRENTVDSRRKVL